MKVTYYAILGYMNAESLAKAEAPFCCEVDQQGLITEDCRPEWKNAPSGNKHWLGHLYSLYCHFVIWVMLANE